MTKLIPYLLSLSLLFQQNVVKGDFLEQYLNRKVFGANPGPCPNAANSCHILLDPDNIPQSVGDATFCLDVIIEHCKPLREWLVGGEIDLYNVQCSEIGIEDGTLTEISKSSSVVNTAVSFSGVDQHCTGHAIITELELDVKIFFDGIIVVLSVDTDFQTQPDEDGISLDFDLRLEAAGGFDNNLVDGGSISNCDMELDLGLEMINPDIQQVDVFGINFAALLNGGLLNILIGIIEGALAASICGIIEQAGFLQNGQPGILTELLGDLNEKYDELTAPTTINVEGDNTRLKTSPGDFGSNNAEIGLSVNLADSNFIEFLSVSINQFLGAENVSPLPVNQAIDLLTEPDGVFSIDVSDSDISQIIPVNIADVQVKFETLLIEDLNTITQFNFLQNDFTEGGDGLDYTLRHSFAMDTVTFKIRLEMTFMRGEWVTASSCGTLASGFQSFPQCNDRETFTFDFGMTASNVEFEAATLIASNLDAISELHIGQVVPGDLSQFEDDPIAAAKATLNCVAPSIYVLYLSDLAVSIGSLSEPVVDNFSGDGLTSLILNTVDLSTVLLKNLLANDLRDIMRGRLREEANALLREHVGDVQSFADCPNFVPVTSQDPFLHFDEFPLSNVLTVVNDVLGDFDASSGVDANDFVQVVLEYYSENAEGFPLEAVSSSSVGDWTTKADFVPLGSLPAFEDAFQGAENAFIEFEKIEILNLNTISSLQVESLGATGIDVQTILGGVSSAAEGLTLLFTFDFQATGLPSPVSDRFTLGVEFKSLDIDMEITELAINLDSIRKLQLKHLLHVPCIESILDGVTVNVANSHVFGQELSFSLDLHSNSNSPLGDALEKLRDELSNPGDDLPRTLNYFIDIGLEQILLSVNSGDYSSVPEGCENRESTLGNIFDLFQGVGLPNATYIAEVCLADIAVLPPAAEYEMGLLGITDLEELEGDYLNLQTNPIAVFASKLLGGSKGSSDASAIENILLVFANTTGNLVSDLFILEDDDETVSLVVPLNEASTLLEILGIEPLHISNDEGFIGEVSQVKIRGLNNFLDNIKLLQPVSPFTTNSHIEFSAANPLILEIEVFVQANGEIIHDDPPGTLVKEFITISMELRGVKIDLATVTAIRADILKELSVAHFLTVNEEQQFGLTDFSGSCFFKNMYPNGFNIRDFRIDITEISEPQLVATGTLISEGFQDFTREVIAIVKEFYIKAVPNICQNCLREVMNQALTDAIIKAQESSDCPGSVAVTPISEENDIFRFSDSEGFLDIQEKLKQTLFADDYEVWNLFISGLTSETFFDEIPFDTGLLDLKYKGVFYGSLEVVLRDLEFDNLKFTNVKLLEPVPRSTENFNEEVDPYKVRFALSFGSNYFAEIASIIDIIGFDLFIPAEPEDGEIVDGRTVVENNVGLGVGLQDLVLDTELVVKLSLNRLMKLQFDQIDERKEIPCLIVPLSEFEIQSFTFSTTAISVSISCEGQCDSTLIRDLAFGSEFNSTNDEELSATINKASEFLQDYLASSPTQELINVALDTSEESCATILDNIDDILNDHGNDVDAFSSMLYIFLGFIGVSAVLLSLQVPRHRRRLKKRIAETKAWDQKEFSEEDELELLKIKTSSLSASPAIPTCMKIFIPLVCLINIAGLWVAILTQGMLTVQLTFTVMAMEMTTINLVPMSVISTVNDTWSSGAWPLSVLLAVASCAWPIVKNALLLIVYVSPGTLIAQEKRGRFLEILDILGKWSLLDVFVVIITQAALFTFVTISQLESLSFLDEKFFETVVTAEPNYGIVILSAVAACSLLINHVMAYYQHKTIEYGRKLYDKKKGNTEPPKELNKRRGLSNYWFRKAHRQVDPAKIKCLLIFNFVTAFAVVVGVFVNVISFEQNGLVGVFTEQLDPATSFRSYSIATLGMTISESPSDTVYQRFVIFLFQFMYYLVSVIMPIAQAIVITMVLTMKFSLRRLPTMIETLMIVSFWAALECVFVGIMITVVEISQVIKFVVDFITDDICTNLESIFAIFIPTEEDANCLSVIGSLEIEGAALLAIGAFGQLLTLIITAVLAFRVQEDRYYHAYTATKLRRDGKPRTLGWTRRRIIKFMTMKEKVTRKNSKQASSRTSRGGEEYAETPPSPAAAQATFAARYSKDEADEVGPLGRSSGSSQNPFYDGAEAALQPKSAPQRRGRESRRGKTIGANERESAATRVQNQARDSVSPSIPTMIKTPSEMAPQANNDGSDSDIDI